MRTLKPYPHIPFVTLVPAQLTKSPLYPTTYPCARKEGGIHIENTIPPKERSLKLHKRDKNVKEGEEITSIWLSSCHHFETRSLVRLQPQLHKKEWVGREVVGKNAPNADSASVSRTGSPHRGFRTLVEEHPSAMAW